MAKSKYPFPINKMISAYTHEKHTNLIIYGRSGIGKSKTALILAYSLLYYRKHRTIPKRPEDFKDYDLISKIVRKYFIFTPEQLINKLKKKKRRYAVLVIDDANIAFHSELYRTNPKLYFRLVGVFATIRTKVANLITTCIDPQELIKPLRQMSAWYGKAYMKNNVHILKIQELVTTPIRSYLKTLGYFMWDDDLLDRRAYHIYNLFRLKLGEYAVEKAAEALYEEKNKDNI